MSTTMGTINESRTAGFNRGTKDATDGVAARVYLAASGRMVWRCDDLPDHFDPAEWAAGYCAGFEKTSRLAA